MKKVLFSFVLLAVALSTIVSCKKKELIEPLAPGSAIVKGKLTAKLDETSLTPVAVPAGTGVTFIIDGKDLDKNPDPNYAYENTVVRGTTDANGNYSVSLPARNKSITVQVRYDEFEYNATILTTNDQGFQVPTTVRKTFKAMDGEVEIVDGVVKVNDMNYDMEGDETSEHAIVKGIFKGVFNDQTNALVAVPANVVLTFTASDGSKYKVTTNSNGEYTVKVPVLNSVDEIMLGMADFEYASTYYSNNAYVNGTKIYGFNSTSFNVVADQISERNYSVYRKN
jgi:hypothetical protein